jgi:hypothetical protein
MRQLEAYLLMDDPEAYTLMVGQPTREDLIAAAKCLASQPAIIATAPGRVARNVEAVLLELFDVEEDWS